MIGAGYLGRAMLLLSFRRCAWHSPSRSLRATLNITETCTLHAYLIERSLCALPMFLVQMSRLSVIQTRRQLGKSAYGCMRRLVIYMNECPTDVWQDLDLVLQFLTQIVSLPQRRVCIHDNVNLDVVILSHGIKSSEQARGLVYVQVHSAHKRCQRRKDLGILED